MNLWMYTKQFRLDSCQTIFVNSVLHPPAVLNVQAYRLCWAVILAVMFFSVFIVMPFYSVSSVIILSVLYIYVQCCMNVLC